MSVEELEMFCKQAYEAVDAETRSRAEQVCLSITESHNCYEMCNLLLERANSHYSQMVAISSLTKLVNQSQGNLSIAQRLELRNMAINYLLQRENLAEFIVKGITGLICRITKLGWLDTNKEDEFPFREIISPLMQMVKSGQPRPIQLGVQILYNLVYEFNQSYEGEVTRSTILIRKIANTFRELQLYDIFITSIELLGHMLNNIKSLNLYDNVQHSIVKYGLKLTLACLSYDFIGTSGGEEVCDDMVNVQVPTNWRHAFLSPSSNPDPLPLFFQLYKNLPRQLGKLALSCLVQTASFRRSFFNNNERQTFLSQLVAGVCEILPDSPTDSDCRNELCRLLCRLKSNFQLGELVSLSQYPQFMELLTRFTVQLLEASSNPQRRSNTTEDDNGSRNNQHYLLVTWQRLVASLPYLRCSQPHLLDVYCPQVLDAYVRSRLNSCGVADSGNRNTNGGVSGDSWNDMEDEVGVPQELESVSVLARCQYARTVHMLAGLFDQVTGRNGVNLLTQLRELCWLVLLMGACIAGRATGGIISTGSSSGGGSNGSSSSTNASVDDGDRLDGELVSRILQLVMQGPLLDRSPNNTNSSVLHAMAALEIAILHFLDQLRRVYLSGESCLRAARLFEVLQGRVGVEDDTALLDQVVRKVLQNLRMWSLTSKAVISRSLLLLHELTLGAVAKRMVQLQVVQALLESRSPVLDLPFLEARELSDVAFGSSSSTAGGKSTVNDLYRHGGIQLSAASGGCAAASSNSRTCFYACMTRLLLIVGNSTGGNSNNPRGTPDDPRNSGLLLEFLAPLTRTCDNISEMLSQCTPGSEPHIRLALLGLLRDIRGVALACHSRSAYHALFDWLFPGVFSLLVLAVDKLAPNYNVGSSSGINNTGNNNTSSVCSSDNDTGGVVLGCLRIARELCLSRNNRLQQSTAPVGELVFRAGARILITYGDRLVANVNGPPPSQHRYLQLVREATAALELLHNLLTGNYINLGALLLYQDQSLELCLAIFLHIMRTIPPSDLLAYPKLARAYYTITDSITQDHLIWLGTQSPEMILYFVNTISEGLNSTEVSSNCCSSLDNLATFLLKLSQSRVPVLVNGNSAAGDSYLSQPKQPDLRMLALKVDVQQALDSFHHTAKLLNERETKSRARWLFLLDNNSGTNGSELRATLYRTMESLLDSLMQPECKNQWAMSRPLLCLILLDTEAFGRLQNSIIAQRTGTPNNDRDDSALKSAFYRLMENVNNSLTIRNRDKFTQNLNTFRHSLSGSNSNRPVMDHSSIEMMG